MQEEDEVIRIYGPRFRTVVREKILDKLFTSQLTRIREDMRKVVRENNRINGHVGNARHRNKIYDPDGITSSWKKKIPLIPELALEMDKLIDENTTAQEESTRIYNYVTDLVKSCKSVADLFYLFPEPLHSKIPNRLHKLNNEIESEITIKPEFKIAFEQKHQKARDETVMRLLTTMLLN